MNCLAAADKCTRPLLHFVGFRSKFERNAPVKMQLV